MKDERPYIVHRYEKQYPQRKVYWQIRRAGSLKAIFTWLTFDYAKRKAGTLARRYGVPAYIVEHPDTAGISSPVQIVETFPPQGHRMTCPRCEDYRSVPVREHSPFGPFFRCPRQACSWKGTDDEMDMIRWNRARKAAEAIRPEDYA